MFTSGCTGAGSPEYSQNIMPLYDIWALKQVVNTKISPKTMQNIHMEFNTQKLSFIGSDGCNSIFGSLSELTRSKLIFGNIASTMMACDDMETPSIYNQLLRKVRFYKIVNLKLYLQDVSRNNLLIFVKVD